MPTLQICSAQPDNQIVYVTNDNLTAANQDYSSYESSAYPSSYRSSSSYELYDAASGSQSLAVSEYASGFDDYGSSYGSAEDSFQINVWNSLIGILALCFIGYALFWLIENLILYAFI